MMGKYKFAKAFDDTPVFVDTENEERCLEISDVERILDEHEEMTKRQEECKHLYWHEEKSVSIKSAIYFPIIHRPSFSSSINFTA